jgi:hypothetical protein
MTVDEFLRATLQTVHEQFPEVGFFLAAAIYDEKASEREICTMTNMCPEEAEGVLEAIVEGEEEDEGQVEEFQTYVVDSPTLN